jgi:hypothetical protein
LKLFALDGTWTPYFSVDPSSLLILELITFAVELFFFIAYNETRKKEQQWSYSMILLAVGVANLISFSLGLILILFVWR